MDYAASKAALDEEREKLIHQLEELGANAEGELTGDVDFGDGFADAGAATAERTEVLGLVEALGEKLRSVNAALGRIEDGSYGACTNCGKQIGEARLEARPNSSFCMECKSASV